MYKRLAVIAVLVGLPIFIQPSLKASEPAIESVAKPAASSAVTIRSTTTALVTTTSTTVATTVSTTAAPTAAPTTTIPTTTTTATTAAPTTAPPTTPAPTTAPPATITDDYQARGEAALAGISYNWQGNLPGWSVTFSPGRDGVIGLTYTNENRIEIFVRDDMSDSLLRHVIAHELGHAVDVTLNSSDDRQRWQDARGIGASPWWPGNGVSDYSTGAGDFAECFAAWQVGSGNFRSKLGSAPNGDQIALLAELAG